MFPAMACQNCNAANDDAYCDSIPDAVPGCCSKHTNDFCRMFYDDIVPGITKIRRYLVDIVLLHSSCLMNDVLQNGYAILNILFTVKL